MSLREKIQADLKEAMKTADAFRLETLRLLTSALHNREIEKKTKKGESALVEEEVLEVLAREAKKRKEAAEIYAKGGRNDLAEKEKKEFAIVNSYLPAQLPQEEVEKIVQAVLARAGAVSQKDFGRVMGEVMKELKGRVDASAVSAILKQKIGD